jgi:glutamine amidotransferase
MSPIVFAHIRAAIGSPVQETNCHPFRHGRWLFMHNGFIGDFAKVKRDLVLAVDPSLFASMEGSADTEVMLHLALTFGLEDDPPAAMEATVGLIEEVGRKHGVEHPIQMTVATTNGQSVWVFRYSSERNSRSLFFTTAVDTLRKLHPELEVLELVDDETRLVVSEPLRDLPGVWNEVPESSWGVIQPGQDELHAFKPKAPTSGTAIPAGV